MNSQNLDHLYHDSKASAKKAGLVFINLQENNKGYLRDKKTKNTFDYVDKKGKHITNQSTVARIQALGIPPAWKNVWISASAKSHIQAVGIDKKGNKQYIYHKEWNTFREKVKFDRLIHFGQILPTLRKEIKKHLNDQELTREKIIATVLSLMDEFSIRIGNESYAEENKTYGLTTLEDRHVDVNKGTISLHFVGKSHKEHSYNLKNKKLASIVQESKEVPGKHLFQYFDETEHRHPLTSTEVNNFIKELTNEQFTAKDFRMWAATVHAYSLLKQECTQKLTSAESKKSLKKVIICVAEQLGNTAAVCKAHYIHSKLQIYFEEGRLTPLISKIKKVTPSAYMKADELELQVLLEKLI